MRDCEHGVFSSVSDTGQMEHEWADPDSPRWRDDPWRHVFEERTYFSRAFCHGARVLDVPCGSGWTAVRLAEVASQVVGVDVDAAAIRHARRENTAPNVTYRQMDALALDFQAGSFDTAISLEALEHFEPAQAGRYLRQLHRVLKIGGWIAGSTPAAEDDAMARWKLENSRDKGHCQIYTEAALRRELSRCFSEVKIVRMPQDYFLFCAVKWAPTVGLRSRVITLVRRLKRRLVRLARAARRKLFPRGED